MIGWLLFGYVLIASALCVIAYRLTGGNIDEFMKLTGVYLAFLTSMLTAVITYLNGRKQEKASAELENLKRTLSGDLEALKVRLSAESKSCEELLRAMDMYYYALADLEEATFDSDKVNKADAEMKSVAYHVNRLHRTCKLAFERYWQQARYIKEMVEPLTTDDEHKQLWKTQTRPLADLHTDFVDKCRTFHRFAGQGVK